MQPGDIKTFLVLYFALPALPLVLLGQRTAVFVVFMAELFALPVIIAMWARRGQRRREP